MEKKRNMKSKIWVYAVVLFTSAFIVLLITAYSQIRQQKSIDNLNTQINKQQNEKKKYQLSFANAQEIITKLTGENEKLADENKNFQNTIDKQISDLNIMEEELQEKIRQYGKLSEAQSEYIKGNIVASAQIFQKINPDAFDEKAVEAYTSLSARAYSEAGRQVFDEGYKLYQQTDYSEAKSKFLLSREFSNKDSYSDNCLYYLAYAYYRTGDKTAALYLMKTLVQDYPASSFVKYARNFIHKYE
ncbi:MAG: hypothetical protein FIA99_08705 [Ruminiclostridium sp.]|nr:hypothetical protein [Ruminiclostridium sp.]